jgi:hypothetical protein
MIRCGEQRGVNLQNQLQKLNLEILHCQPKSMLDLAAKTLNHWKWSTKGARSFSSLTNKASSCPQGKTEQHQTVERRPA